jgi:hypothetical protein
LPRNNENVFNNRIKYKSEGEKVIWVIKNHIPNSTTPHPLLNWIHSKAFQQQFKEPVNLINIGNNARATSKGPICRSRACAKD